MTCLHHSAAAILTALRDTTTVAASAAFHAREAKRVAYQALGGMYSRETYPRDGCTISIVMGIGANARHTVEVRTPMGRTIEVYPAKDAQSALDIVRRWLEGRPAEESSFSECRRVRAEREALPKAGGDAVHELDLKKSSEGGLSLPSDEASRSVHLR